MKNFPSVLPSQVVLVRADYKTGNLLDELCQLVLSDAQEVYTIFDSLELALIYSKKIIEEKSNIEIVIYDWKKVVLKYIIPE